MNVDLDNLKLVNTKSDSLMLNVMASFSCKSQKLVCMSALFPCKYVQQLRKCKLSQVTD